MNPTDHSPEAIASRLEAGNEHDYLKDFIYGAIDGTVTTFAVVSGVAGAGLSTSVIIVLGLANLVGDGFSMAAGNYLGTRAEEQVRDKARRSEELQIENHPEGEIEEVRQILARKGMEGEVLEGAVKSITSDKKRWVDMMLQEELGHSLNGPSPMKSAVITFVAFLLVGLVPLLAFLVPLLIDTGTFNPYVWSTVLTGLAFFSIGAAKSTVVEQGWLAAGMETLVVGGSAAGLAYLVGAMLRDLA